MSESVLQVEIEAGIATLTMNRPEAMNALSAALRSALAEAFETLSTNDDVGVLILTGAGERAFTAGLDLRELAGSFQTPGDGETAAGGDGPSEDRDPVAAMAACPKPIVGAINGVAITGGFELALACDVLVASTNARFADTHARVGILPGWGLSQKLSRLIGISRAKELSLTGNFLGAEEAADWGLVNRVVAPDALLPHCRALAADMLSCPRPMVERYKAIIDAGFAADFGTAMTLESEASRAHLRGVSADAIEESRQAVTARGRKLGS